jgi:DNA-binding MarR family transcriptional regulator
MISRRYSYSMSSSTPRRHDDQGPAGVAFLLAQVGGLAAYRFAERLQPLGTDPPQAGLLRAIAEAPGRSQQALSTQLGLLPSRLVAMVDELETEGLVERRRNPQDRRHHALYVTARGEERLAALGRQARAHGETLLEPLTERERGTLGRLLRKVADHHGLAPGVHPGYRAMGRARGDGERNAPTGQRQRR